MRGQGRGQGRVANGPPAEAYAEAITVAGWDDSRLPAADRLQRGVGAAPGHGEAGGADGAAAAVLVAWPAGTGTAAGAAG